jgi:hypothetical protein
MSTIVSLTKPIKTLCLLLLLTSCSGGQSNTTTETPPKPPLVVDIPVELDIEIPVAGNSWVVNNIERSSELIGDQGLHNWQNSSDEIVTYVYLGQTGSLDIGIKGKVSSGSSTIELSLEGVNHQLTLTNTSNELVYAGEYEVLRTGYQKIIIRGMSASGSEFATISDVAIGGAASEGEVYYVKDDFYWGRRGPSVHLNYSKPNPGENNEWFYAEIEVPQGSDTLGSYFMTNGFGEGYMGIQVNSATERRILFSVWSPFITDDPNTIPEEDKIQLLGRGENVKIGEFGNEGSGGQSYFVYDWQPDTTYKLLVNIKPSEEAGKTDYSGYFFTPETNEWKLIASFRRPKTTTYVTNQYAFLENFVPATGQIERKGLYKNNWLVSESGQWYPLTKATFTYDATAAKQARLDYQGGLENGVFYLQNTGFFSDSTPYNSVFETSYGIQPDLDFNNLPAGGN